MYHHHQQNGVPFAQPQAQAQSQSQQSNQYYGSYTTNASGPQGSMYPHPGTSYPSPAAAQPHQWQQQHSSDSGGPATSPYSADYSIAQSPGQSWAHAQSSYDRGDLLRTGTPGSSMQFDGSDAGSVAGSESTIPAKRRAPSPDGGPEGFSTVGGVVPPPRTTTTTRPPPGVGRCTSCKTTSSPEWRKGPSGKKELCNAYVFASFVQRAFGRPLFLAGVG